MRSTLESIQGEFEHAIFTTYSVNLHFFEQWVLPLLREAGARNVVVLVDEAQLGAALADRNLKSIGRSYHVLSVRLGPGAFHPKLMLLAGASTVRACISSANLTVDGQLRNVESAIVLDSSIETHRPALTDVCAFVRSVVAKEAPAPTAEAVMAGLEAAEALPEERPEGGIRVVDNLARPLIEHFPTADITAVTPYTDAGAAASRLTESGLLTVITDGESFAAPQSFFGGAWTVIGRDFEKRRLHGKAYWSTGNSVSWLLLGSPNLSRQALLETASEANTELAVVLSPHEPKLPEPPGIPWERDDLAEVAPRRHAAEVESEAAAQEGGSFNAWEDERVIVVEGVSDDSTFEYWHGGKWHLLASAVQGRVIPPPDVRPYLIRCISASGRIKQALVHRTDQLRIHRLRPRGTSRGADVVTTLPLDLAGVQALESVLRDLYLLGSLAEEAEINEQVYERIREREPEAAQGLSGWMPARSEDEPRIPDVYRRTWQNAPDALLALIRGALRIEGVFDTPEEEWEVFEEGLDFDAADREAEEDPEETPDGTPLPPVERAVLSRYRNSLVRLLRRGAEFVEAVEDPALADLAFQSILSLHERIERSPVEVEVEPELLVEHDELLRQKLSLLDGYLRERSGRDPLCLATARAHLGKCVGAKDSWTPLEWEQIENLAYRTGKELLAENEHAAVAAQEAGESLAEITDRLRPYAERADWDGYLALADELLDEADLSTDPFILVEGEYWFDSFEKSAAWRLIGYGAIVGFSERQAYGALLRNAAPRPKYLAHLLICDPASKCVHELFQRGADRRWVGRIYAPVSEGMLDDAGRIGPEALLEGAASRTPFAEIDPPIGLVADALKTGSPSAMT